MEVNPVKLDFEIKNPADLTQDAAEIVLGININYPTYYLDVKGRGRFVSDGSNKNIIDSIEDMSIKQGVLLQNERYVKRHLDNNKIKIKQFIYNFGFTAKRHLPNPEANIE